MSLSSDDLNAIAQAIESSPPSLITIKAAVWYALRNWQPGNLADLLIRCSRLSSYQHIQCGRAVLDLIASNTTQLMPKQAFNQRDKTVLAEHIHHYAKNTLEFPVAELQFWRNWLIQDALLTQSVTQIFTDWPGHVTLELLATEATLNILQTRFDWHEQADTLRQHLSAWVATMTASMQASPTELYSHVLPWLEQVLKIPSADALLLAVRQCQQVSVPERRLECLRYLFNTLLQRNDYAVLRIADDPTYYNALNTLQAAANQMSALTSHQGLLFDAVRAVYQVRQQSVRQGSVSALLASAKQVDEQYSAQSQDYRMQALFWIVDKRAQISLSAQDKRAATDMLVTILPLLRQRSEQAQHSTEAAIALGTSATNAYQQALALKAKFY